MTLAPGTKLGPYEIVAPLGAGGMGEVYRAKDTRLGREVAVKVLPQHLSANPEVRARFEREAKTVSSLNHPHICTLFDVGRAPGEAGSADIDYLVMELIEGETLAARIRRGPLPPADVLKLGGQIADALDRAHRAGVVHRDLKPGNVMLTRSGAKLMDFGLARATGMAGPASGSGLTQAALTQSPTAAAPLTAEGTIVGTFQYMSPEQLEGKEADARSDLWALGCVLHEMATGRRAFEGASQASLIAAIMSGVPAPVSQLVPVAPPALDRVVGACLAKDPADRIQSAHDVKLQLGWIAEPGSQSGATAAPASRPPARRGAPLLTGLAFAVGALGLAAAAVTGWLAAGRREPAVIAQVPMPRDFQLGPFQSSLAISPDGGRVVAAAQHGSDPSMLWLWSLDSPEPRALPGTERGGIPAWSPDGRSLAFASMGQRTLFRLPADGGGPTRLADVSDSRGVSWGAKDVIVYAPSASGPLLRIPATGGNPEPATELDASRGEGSHRFPYFLPDGEHFLFAALPPGPNGFAIRVGSLGSRKSRVVLEARSGALWAPPGYLVFVESGKLTAQRFDLGRLRVTGAKFVIGDAPPPSDMDADMPASASRDGRLLYVSRPVAEARLEWLGRDGASLGAVGVPPGDWWVLALSPDQRSALAAFGDQLHQVDLERGVSTRLLEHVDPAELALWSPDGRRIVATSREARREVLRFLNSGGSGQRDSVPGEPALFMDPQGWAPDGRSLLVAVLGRLRPGADQNTSWDLWVFPLDGRPPSPWLATPAFERYAALSPDGRWAACLPRVEGQVEMFVDSYPVPGHRVQVFSPRPLGFQFFAWGRQGRELLYVDKAGDVVSVPVTPGGEALRVGRPSRLFRVPADVTSMVSLDGARFLVARDEASTTPSAMRLVLHWEGLLKR